MLPARPRSYVRPFVRRRLLLTALLACGLAAAPPCLALEVEMDPPRERGGYVWANLYLIDVISPRVEGSLTRGMPATLQFHAELWRQRRGWFDRLESSFDASLRIRYEVWSERFLIERRGQSPVAVSTLDSARIALSRPIGLPVGRVAPLQPGMRYYVLMSVTLKPLSVEDFEEGEGWLSGEVENKRRAGFGIITAIPRSLFDAVRNFAGFGDEHARALTDDFTLEDLFPAP